MICSSATYISTPEGAKFAFDNNLFTEFCPLMVANAVDVLEEIIAETDKEQNDLKG